MEKRRSSFPFVFRRSRPNSPDSFTDKRTLDIIHQNSNTPSNTFPNTSVSINNNCITSDNSRNRKSNTYKTSSNQNTAYNNNNNNNNNYSRDNHNNSEDSNSLLSSNLQILSNDSDDIKSHGKTNKKSVSSVSGALFNVIPVISLTSTDNETIDDIDKHQEDVEVITVLPA